MFQPILNSKYKTVIGFQLFVFLFILLSKVGITAQDIDYSINPITEQAVKAIHKLDYEIESHGNYISESLLNCSYYQDALLAFLHDAPSAEEFLRGMRLIEEHSHGFKSICRYSSTAVNFYTGDDNFPTPQKVPVNFQGEEATGFLNKFKIDNDLTNEERERYFHQEESKYLSDCIEAPFILDETTLEEIKKEVVYNFVLFPNGKIRAALERPGDKEYHVREEAVIEAFKYPNHTILAGDPQQAVVTAGSFQCYKVDHKWLFFVSCKSGHFQPTYESLFHMKTQLSSIGVDPSTVICVPDVNLSGVVLKIYTAAQVPLSINRQDTERLFNQSQNRWKEVYREIDRDFLSSLAQGELNVLDEEVIEILNKQREEATFMRSAYHLYSAGHEAPKNFHKLVKGFGKLKDAIKHGVAKRIQSEASHMIQLMDKYESEMLFYAFIPADDRSFYEFISQRISRIEELLSQKRLLIEEYHQLKKISRELAVLFMDIAQDIKWKGKGYFISSTASDAFFQINELMGKVHDSYVSKLMQGQLDSEEPVYVELSQKIVQQLRWYCKHLGISPPTYTLEIIPEAAWWMINYAKDCYSSHDNFASDRQTTETKMAIALLKYIIKGNTFDPNRDYSMEVLCLKKVLRDDEIARNALIFLDASHEAPEDLTNFINKIKNVIDAMDKKEIDSVKEDARFVLEILQGDFPTLALEEWQCSGQASFNETLKDYLYDLKNLKIDINISKIRAETIVKNLTAFQDLLNLYRRNGIKKRGDSLPAVCYDTLEEHAYALIGELQQAINQLKEGLEEITVTPEMSCHAFFILSKLTLVSLEEVTICSGSTQGMCMLQELSLAAS